MTPKQRFLGAIHRQPVDRVPLFDFLFQRPLFTELIGRTPESYNARDAMDLTQALGLDGVWIPYGCFAGWAPEKLGDNLYIDEWGTTFEQRETSWPIDAPIAYPLPNREALAGYTPPNAHGAGRLDEINTAIAMNKAFGDREVAIFGGVGGPLTTAWMLVGYEDICMALYDDPDFIKEVAQFAVDFALVAATRMAEAGVDGMVVSEDLGSSTGGLLSPAKFREVLKPALGTIISHIKSLGLPVMLHSCGCIYEFLDDVVGLGIDAIHPLQRTAGMDLGRVKAQYGDRVCIVGNIDSSRTLPYGTPEEIEAEVREAIAAAAPGGGYILASDHSLHDGISVRNIRAMFDAARKYGVYPDLV
ncbi:MAG: uroporphyrinogen decarboxylase family protein [Armatimonadota bacterium]